SPARLSAISPGRARRRVNETKVIPSRSGTKSTTFLIMYCVITFNSLVKSHDRLRKPLSYPFHDHRYTLSPADAEGGQAQRDIPAHHLKEEGHKYPGPAGSHRVSQGDGAAKDIHLIHVPSHFPVYLDRLRGKGLVDLYEIKIVYRAAMRSCYELLACVDRAKPHVCGV